MTTYATYVKTTLTTSNPNLCAVGGITNIQRRASRSGQASRTDNRSRPYLSSATPHGKQSVQQQQPATREEDLETVIDLSTDVLDFDETGKRCYSRACQKLDVVPSSHILTKLSTSKAIDCRHYGLGPRGTMALSIALVVNSRVTSLNLQGNDIGQKGMSYIQKMVSESHTLTELNLSDNKVGSYGANAINKMLADNRSIHKLELAGNDFTDKDASLIAKALQEHPELEYVDLSHNMFGDKSGEYFEEMISENSAIHTLDLSWNLFRGEGTKFITKGLAENTFMKTLNFSWNGIGDDGAVQFSKMLKVNSILTSLDLSACRIFHDGFIKIITALGLNESLVKLRLGKNNIPEEFAEMACAMLKTYPALKLDTLDLSDCTYSAKFEQHVQTLNDLHRHVEVIYGYSSNYGKHKGDNMAEILREGLECLRDFCKENNVSLVELFERFDTDNSMSVTLQEFQEGLKEAGVPLSLYKIEMFAHALDKDGDGEVDYSEMVLQMKQS